MEYTLDITPNGAFNYKTKSEHYVITADNYTIFNDVITFFVKEVVNGNREDISVASFGLRDVAYSIVTDKVKTVA